MIASEFSALPTNLDLGYNDIHIWCAALDQPQCLMQSLVNTLSVDEKKRADRFRFEHDRRRFIAGRGVLRLLLAQYLSVEPDRIRFYYHPYGKPFIAECLNEKGVHFNLSHSEGYALFGFTCRRKIGVDIEYIQVISEMEEIANRFFSFQEKRVLKGLPDQEKNAVFYNFWTRKEAFAKAVGTGLGQAFDQIDVSQCPGPPSLEMSREDLSEKEFCWSIQDLNPVPGFAAAIAIEGMTGPVHYWEWSEFLAKFSRNRTSAKHIALN